MAETDQAKLLELLKGVTISQADLAAMVGNLAGLNKAGNTDPDDIPEPPDEATTKPGDLWLLGDHRLLCGDAGRVEDLDRLLDGAPASLLATDPPYGVQLDPTWRDHVYNDRIGGKNIDAAKPYMRKPGHLNTTFSGDTVVDWSPVYALVPSLEVAYVWHAGLHAAEVAIGIEALGFEIRSQIIWTKTQFAMGRGAYQWQHEPCWYAVRKGATAGWLGGHEYSTLWEAASPKMIMGGSDEAKEDHPAQKPIVCLERPIEKHEGDVYEPSMGSGTTLIAAERQGRRCYAMEIESRYVQVAKERWEAFTGKEGDAWLAPWPPRAPRSAHVPR